MSIVAIIALLAAFIVREYSHYIHDERRDRLIDALTDKIKARDFTEYRMMTDEVPVYEPVDNDDSNLYNRELQENKR
ncbi:hypothetical protein [Paenibacillus spongiae]|uniref:Uncharacterized protein n=1 Tax=Paenibacillus spongiae TaxID=2909671 RepID=A0ABY5SB81_9BACL|nr:hypothetical protein [Paenibacillus spongiae]UVI31206.1 hypothetical protein L1F29_05010 [Paenibacillus spongiae]